MHGLNPTYCAVLRRQRFGLGEAPRGGERRDVDGGHLGRQHRLDLIARLDALDDGQHEI